MSRLLARGFVVLMLVGFSGLLASAQPPPPPPPPPIDEISGTLQATGKAGSGDITLTVTGSTSLPNSTIQCDYYYHDGKDWKFSGTKDDFSQANAGNFNATFPAVTMISGKTCYAACFILRGDPPVVVAQKASNTVVAP